MDDSRQRPKRTDTLRLTQEFSEKFFKETMQRIAITDLSVIIDDIRNYRTLTDVQLAQLRELSDADKIEIIQTYNTMFGTLENVINAK
jgi:uncharacterized protein YjgD (DUF1641 family)